MSHGTNLKSCLPAVDKWKRDRCHVIKSLLTLQWETNGPWGDKWEQQSRVCLFYTSRHGRHMRTAGTVTRTRPQCPQWTPQTQATTHHPAHPARAPPPPPPWSVDPLVCWPSGFLVVGSLMVLWSPDLLILWFSPFRLNLTCTFRHTAPKLLRGRAEPIAPR